MLFSTLRNTNSGVDVNCSFYIRELIYADTLMLWVMRDTLKMD